MLLASPWNEDVFNLLYAKFRDLRDESPSKQDRMPASSKQLKFM